MILLILLLWFIYYNGFSDKKLRYLGPGKGPRSSKKMQRTPLSNVMFVYEISDQSDKKQGEKTNHRPLKIYI